MTIEAKDQKQTVSESKIHKNNTIKTYRLKKENKALALILALGMILFGLYAISYSSSVGLGRFTVLCGGLMAMFLGGMVLLFLLFPSSLLITDEYIQLKGLGGWVCNWNNISTAKIIKRNLNEGTSAKSVYDLAFYSKEESEKIVGTIHSLRSFEKSDEIVNLIAKRLGQVTLEEIIQEAP